MKTEDAVTILDHFAWALLPVALQMNNGNMKDAVTDSYEMALEVLKQRQSFHTRALHELEGRSGRLDAAEFNERIVHSSDDPRPGEDR